VTAAAVLIDPDVCPDCRKPHNLGLCGKEICRKQVLPQIAKPALVRLIGDAMVEQTKRQRQTLTQTEKAKVAAIGRRNARKMAKGRRGYFGLAKAILGR
jgi:hypothetical protein